MKYFNIFLLVALCIASITADGLSNIPVPPIIYSSTDPPTSTSTSTTSTTSTTTIAPPITTSKTTTAPKTTTTSKPTPPTPKPSPPTPKPSPPTPKPSPPTPKPSPTTPKPSPTTPAPTPAKPDVVIWNITDHVSNQTCIMAKMAVQIEVDYVEKNITKNVLINIPKNASASGICLGPFQSFSLAWNVTGNITDTINFKFIKNDTTSEVTLDHLELTLNGVHFSNETKMNFFYDHPEFEAPLEHSYKCNKEQVLKLNRSSAMTTNCTAALKISDLQIQAYRNSTTGQFDEAIDCIPVSTSDVVPIAVGCALAALVVIVLLAYLYGRRRSQARGYLSM